jgi:competence protein ComFC
MTIDEFKKKVGAEIVKLYTVGQHYYAEPLTVKLNINKDIVTADWKDKHTFQVIEYLDEYVISKDGQINQYGLKISGKWSDGYALDYHTTKSEPAEVNENGEVLSWNTMRPPIGEELYRLKYWREKYRTDRIASPAADFLKKLNQNWNIDVIIPVPPSDTEREFQPVLELANAIGQKLNLSVDHDFLIKTKQTSQLKEVLIPAERKEILKDAFSIKNGNYKGKNVLIFDDLYRSGATMNVVADVLLNKGAVNSVYVLTITKTRRHR